MTDLPMVRATMHGGPRDGETVDLPWARMEFAFPRFDSPGLDGIGEDLYRLRPPWRGGDAEYDYVEVDEPAHTGVLRAKRVRFRSFLRRKRVR